MFTEAVLSVTHQKVAVTLHNQNQLMKTALKILLLLLLASAPNIYSQTAEEFYDKAVKFEEANDYANALATVGKALEAYPANEALYIYNVTLLFNSGRQTEALALMQSLADVNEYDELMIKTHSLLLYNSGDKQKAFAILETFLTRHESADTSILLSSLYEQDGRFDKAVTVFAPLAATLADNPKAQVRYSELLMLAGKAPDAEKVLLTALKKEPDNQYVQYQLAEAYVAQKKYNDALATLNTLVANHPVEEMYKSRGICYRLLGRDDMAYADCLAMLQINDCSMDAFGFIIEYEFLNNKFADLIEHSNKALACNPDAEGLLLPFLFPAYYFMGQDAKAEAVLDKFLATNPTTASPYFVKGAALIKQGRYAAALPFLEKSLAMQDIKPEETQVVNHMRVGIWLVTEQYDALADFSDSLAKTAADSGGKTSPKLPGNFSVNPGSRSEKATVTVTFNQQDTRILCTVSVPVDTVDMLKERYGIRLF